MAYNGNIAQYVLDAIQSHGMQNNVPPQAQAIFPDFALLEQIDGQQPANSLQQYINQLDANPITSIPPMGQQQIGLPQMANPKMPSVASMGGPLTPPVPVNNISSYIQESLGAKDASQPDFLQSFLASRNSGPSFDDYGRAIQKSAYDTPTGAQDYADQSLKGTFEQLATLEKLNGTTDFDRLVSTYQSMPDSDPRKAIYGQRIKKETTPGASALVQVYNPATNQLEFASPEQIAAGGLQPPKAKPSLNATQTKEIYDATDIITNSESAKAALERAKGLSAGTYGAKPYTGAGSETWAGMDAVPGAGLFVNDERAAATTEYNTLIKEQALSTMKAIFGGNPTEGERQVLLSIQGMSGKTPEQQQRILDNAVRAIDRRIAYNRNKINAIESGDMNALANPSISQAPATGQGGWSIQEVR